MKKKPSKEGLERRKNQEKSASKDLDSKKIEFRD
jgi:hypothetical protein